MTEEILIIRHGALGDLVQSTGPIKAIRAHHPGARITLLTAPAYAGFMAACPWIDRVWRDSRAAWHRPQAWVPLFRQLREANFARVYDLQTSSRSSFYFRVFSAEQRPQWSGIAPGCAFPHENPARDAMHTVDRQREQLAVAGITEVPDPDLSWVQADIARFGLPDDFALLVPGGSAHRPEKRWPADRYGALAGHLAGRGLTPVLLGGPDEGELNATVAAAAAGAGGQAIDLSGRTDFADLVGLGRAARLAVGNDTGPMHMIAAAGCPAVVLFSDASDPALCAPRGGAVRVLRRPSLTELAVGDVAGETDSLQAQISRNARHSG